MIATGHRPRDYWDALWYREKPKMYVWGTNLPEPFTIVFAVASGYSEAFNEVRKAVVRWCNGQGKGAEEAINLGDKILQSLPVEYDVPNACVVAKGTR